MEENLENINPAYIRIREKFPFMTYGQYLEKDYVGIVQNCDNQIISLYCWNKLRDDAQKNKFLELGDLWWWESNRTIPINIFIKHDFEPFRAILKTFNRKDFEIIFGPVISLQDIMSKRIKKRTISLVRKMD